MAILTAEDMAGATPVEPVSDTGQSYAAGLARSAIGQGLLLGWGDEAMAKLREMIGDETYDEALKDERAKVKAFQKQNPKTALVAELAGGLATPGLGLAAGGLRGASTLGRMARGAGVGSIYGAVAGAGGSENDKNLTSDTLRGAGLGLLGGAALPLGAKLATSGINRAVETLGPTVARIRGRLNPSAGTPAERAADFVQIQAMHDANQTPQALRDFFDEVDRARTFNGGVGGGSGSSQAPSPVSLMEASPALRSQVGAAARANPEVMARGEGFIGTRQTGITPVNDVALDAANQGGLTHRNPLGPKAADAALTNPAGQQERIQGAGQRAMLLADPDFHGFKVNPYATEKDMQAALKKVQDKKYGDFRDAQDGFNVLNVPEVDDAIRKWTTRLADTTAQKTETTDIRRALSEFTSDGQRWVTSADAIDKGKQAIDDLIDAAKRSGANATARTYKMVQDDFVKAIDGIKHNNIGVLYKDARQYSSNQYRRLEALQWGRDAHKLNPDAAAEQFNAFPEDQKKLARFGWLDNLGAIVGGKTKADDLTRALGQNNQLDLMRVMIPRSDSAGAVYHTRPEMFGDYLGQEKGMIASRNEILGNSKTAERIQADNRLTRQTLGEMFDRFRSNPSLLNIGIEALSRGLHHVFGFRDDLAAELGRRMFTADRGEIERIITRLEQNWGADRVGQLTRLMQNFGDVAARGVPAVTARRSDEAPSAVRDLRNSRGLLPTP